MRTATYQEEAMRWRSCVLVTAISFAGGCKQYRIVPAHEAWKLSSENVPASGGFDVTDTEGRRVHIERFRFVDVHVTRCSSIQKGQDEFCYVDKTRFRAPLRLQLTHQTLFVTPNPEDWRRAGGTRRKPPRSPGVARFDGVRRVAIVDSSSPRTWTIVGTAAAAGVLTCLATSYAVSSVDTDDPHGLRAVLLGAWAGSAAAGLSLLITFPATRDLGQVVE
jgi:hypothetical protein